MQERTFSRHLWGCTNVQLFRSCHSKRCQMEKSLISCIPIIYFYANFFSIINIMKRRGWLHKIRSIRHSFCDFIYYVNFYRFRKLRMRTLHNGCSDWKEFLRKRDELIFHFIFCSCIESPFWQHTLDSIGWKFCIKYLWCALTLKYKFHENEWIIVCIN